jgi:ribonuclease BN (tRNA processing enzyme)
VAARAGVKTLVLSHLMGRDDPAELRRVVARDFGGAIVVGEDLASV